MLGVVAVSEIMKPRRIGRSASSLCGDFCLHNESPSSRRKLLDSRAPLVHNKFRAMIRRRNYGDEKPDDMNRKTDAVF